MAIILISFFMLVLLIVSAFVVLIVLMQKTSNAGGMGSALGGGATEQVLGAETTSVLTRATIYGIVAFFIIALGLHIGYLSATGERQRDPGLRGVAGEEMEADSADEVLTDGSTVEPVEVEMPLEGTTEE